MARFTASSSERLGRVGAGVTRVYLDYASFSPVDPRVVALMRPFLEGGAGDPAAPHSLGLEARASLDGARAKVARLVGATAAGVIFTASATEANNLAIRGLAARAAGRHLVTTAIEHISVLNTCRHLAKRGWEIAYVPVDGEGHVDPDAVARALRDDTALVSVMAANGEIGTLEPLREIGRISRARGVPFHVDAVGAAGRVPLAVDDLAIDLLTLSSNDLYGPPGHAPAAPRQHRREQREGRRRAPGAGPARGRRVVGLGVQHGQRPAVARAARHRLHPRRAGGLALLHARPLDDGRGGGRGARGAARRGGAPAPPRALTCACSSSTSTARWSPRAEPGAPPSAARCRPPTARRAPSTPTTSAARPTRASWAP